MACFLFLAALLADAPPAYVSKFIDKCEAEKPETIKAIEADLKRARGKDAKRAKGLEEQLRAIKAGESLAVPILKFGKKIEVGEAGRSGDPFEVVQVIDDRSMIVKMANADATYWVSGIDTKDVEDGKGITLRVPVVASGTKRYETVAGGSRTVIHLEAVDVSAAEKAWKAR